jgi:hypothetical protein
MPRGKKQLNRPSAGGIIRNDYHRRNRKENKSTHKHSFGANVPSQVFEKADVRVVVLPQSVVEERATSRYKQFGRGKRSYAWELNRIVVMYIRHSLTNYRDVIRDVDTAGYLAASEAVFDAIGCAYPWLAEECLKQHLYRAENGRYGTVRVIKHEAILPRTPYTDYAIDSEEDEGEYLSERGGLNSLASPRFIYFPPFLKPWQIEDRRFSGRLDMNDRWWEWEAELGLEAKEGRPNPRGEE